jgi:hypothetical protein
MGVTHLRYRVVKGARRAVRAGGKRMARLKESQAAAKIKINTILAAKQALYP